MSSKPIIVMVPGSFSPAAVYATFADHLRFYGYEVEVIELLSTRQRGFSPPATMGEDAAQVAAVVKKHCEAGKNVVLVAHSYGGKPAMEGVKGLTSKDFAPHGGGVVRIVYMTACAPLKGSSQEPQADAFQPRDYVELLINDYAKAGAIVFSLLPPREQYEQAKRLSCHSAATLEVTITHDDYLKVPMTYLVAEKDELFTPKYQQSLITDLKLAGADVTVSYFYADHGWFGSVPRSAARSLIQSIESSTQAKKTS